jgi:hypothetical protein
MYSACKLHMPIALSGGLRVGRGMLERLLVTSDRLYRY